MGKLKSYQEQLQDIVEKGINAAEEQQKKLASKPFDYAEKLEAEAREYSVKTLRKRYTGYSENLFEQLRSLNSRFGNFAAELVAKLEKEAAEGADAVSGAAESLPRSRPLVSLRLARRQPRRKQLPPDHNGEL
jgi:DNA repair ATPase RecN